MKKYKKILSALLAAAMLPLSAFTAQIKVQADASALAPSYNTDLNKIIYATPVEDQTQTSYCWAHMANAVLESYLIKNAGNIQIDFSETDMINQLIGGMHGFSDLYTGGSYHQAVAYWTRGSLYGPRIEADSSLTNYYVGETAELGRYEAGNESSKQIYLQNIKNLVVQYGSAGVSVYFNAQDRSQTTWAGAYYYPQESSPGVNHGVTVVGWDDSYPAQSFYNNLTKPQQPRRAGAFLVKNSWGQHDPSSIGGNTGYYWISYDNYFQDAFAVTKVGERSRLYDYIYETDYRGLSEYTAGSSYSQTYQLSSAGQWLSGISTYVRAGAGYRFFINGQELGQIGGTMAHSGYHTFELADPIQIQGANLEIRVEVTGSNEAVPVSCTANSHVPDTSNICLKAFTRASSIPPQSGGSGYYPNVTGAAVSEVAISPQECTVQQGGVQAFSTKVIGTRYPSQRVSWQLSGSSSAVTRLTDSGVLFIGADEASDTLYVYAIAEADNTKSAIATVKVSKVPKVPDSSGTGTDGPGNSTNINGTPADPDTGSDTNQGSSTGSTPGQNGSSGQQTEVKVGIVDKNMYTCREDGTALYSGCSTKNRIMIKVPETVKIGGKTYTVISLEDSCMEKNKKLTSVTVGKNVVQIGDEAFYGCKKLKKIKIKSEQLDYIGSDAFYNISSKAVIYVPRSCLSEYRTMIRESGNAKARVRAYD